MTLVVTIASICGGVVFVSIRLMILSMIAAVDADTDTDADVEDDYSAAVT